MRFCKLSCLHIWLKKKWVYYVWQVSSCDASVDSILKSPDCALPLPSEDRVVCSALSDPSSLEYSPSPYEEEEVNSPPPKSRLVSAASLSPLRPRRILGSPCNIGGHAVKGRRIVYDAEAPPGITYHSLVCASPCFVSYCMLWSYLLCTYSARIELNMQYCYLCRLCFLFCRVRPAVPLLLLYPLHQLFVV